jgi:uncharacterized protein (DUF4415 family)
MEFEWHETKARINAKKHGITFEEAPINKVRITISLDKDVIDYFKSEAKHPGAFPYQTQINHALRQLIEKWHGAAHDDIEEIKSELLHDVAFISKLAKMLKQKHARK